MKINLANYYAIIPARLASTRLKDKVLADIAGKPMFWHTYHAAKKALDQVYLACDDQKVASVAKELGVDYIMTSQEHKSGSDRVYEAAQILGLGTKDILINVQADEPLIEPSVISSLAAVFEDKSVKVASLAYKISAEQALDSNLVKVVLANNNDALYFSRSVIPFVRNDNKDDGYYGHLGIYAYYMDSLARFIKFEQAKLEKLESLEQLRFLENNIPIRMLLTNTKSKGVDCQADLDFVRSKFRVIV